MDMYIENLGNLYLISCKILLKTICLNITLKLTCFLNRNIFSFHFLLLLLVYLYYMRVKNTILISNTLMEVFTITIQF